MWGLPSNINNIKSLSYVPEIVAKGGEWFSGIGTEGSKGTAILCLSGNIKYPGMIEVPMGLTINQVIYDVAGGTPDGRKVKFLQTGRSEEHTSELQSLVNLVCRLLLEKKK